MEGIAMCNSSSTVIRIIDEQGTESVTIANISNSPEVAIQINNVGFLQRLPSRELLEDIKAMKELCVPLHTAAIDGDWGTTIRIIEKDRRTLTSSISTGGQNVLHLAAGTKNVEFVDKLVNLLSIEELELQEDNGNTALIYAVMTAPIEIADILIQKNPNLVSIRNDSKVTPLYMAALFERPDMAHFLYGKTKECLEDIDQIGIFFTCIDNGIYDLARKMLNDNPSLATAKDDVNKTALHHLAETPSAFANGQPEGWTKLASSWFNFKFKRTLKQTSALELVGDLWDNVKNLGHERAMALISSPSELLFDAAKLGNYEFLKVLVTSCPELVWKVHEKNRTIIHVAVLYRHADIFNMIHDIGPKREVIAGFYDAKGNNILHLAAKLPPPDRLKTVSGAALQMQKELLWFEEVEKIVTPRYRRQLNTKNMNPSQVFSSKHRPLMNKGEKWLKETSNSGLIVSTIITTVVFAAAFSLPGGNDNIGRPNDLHYTSFLVFVLSDGLAMLSSVVASLMFLSILTSRYTEYEFRNSLPLKLMTALFALFFSNIAMMIAFSSTIAIACHSGLRWVPFFISLFAFVPIALFAVSQFPLWFDTFSSTYWSRTIFKPTRRTLC